MGDIDDRVWNRIISGGVVAARLRRADDGSRHWAFVCITDEDGAVIHERALNATTAVRFVVGSFHVPVSELDWPQDLYARDVRWSFAPDRAGVRAELARLGVDPAALDVPRRVGYPFHDAPSVSFA